MAATHPDRGVPGQPLDVSGRPVALRDVDLDRFFRPKRVVAIGASDSDRKPNSAMWRKIRSWAEANGAEAIPVHPRRESVDGVPCYPSVLDVPGEIDLAAILTVNVMDVLPDVIEKKAAFAVVFAAGFAEVEGGDEAQAELEDLIAASDLHLLGPNTNLNAFEQFADNPGRAIALITQSGHQGRPIFQAQDLGVRLSHWAPVGNEADLEVADFIRHFARDPEVASLAAYLEGFKDGRTLLLALDSALEQGVPLTCVKVGRTDEGADMAKSHTGHLTGADAVVDAAFRQYGVTRVDGLDELQDIASMFARTAPPKGDGVAIYSISGGTSAHMADMAAHAGLRLTTLGEQTQARLREFIPDYLRVDNPVDSGGGVSGREPSGPAILDAILTDPDVGLLIVPITGVVPTISEPFARHLVAASEQHDTPIFVVWGSPVGDEAAYRDILLDSQLPVFRTFQNCVRAARAYFDYHDFRARYVSPFAEPRLTEDPGAARVRELLVSGAALSEHHSKQALAAYGIPVTSDTLATTRDEAVAAADAIGGDVVLKACGPTLLHKSDLGLVKVGVAPSAVGEAYDEIAGKVPHGTELEGVLVGPMERGGVECVVGISRDEVFGPVVMFGLGGVFVEVLEDVTFRVPPFGRDEAHRMIREVKGFPLLRGTRGSEPVDLDALADVIVRAQAMALDLAGDIAEVDINPLLVRPDGVVALDALVIAR